jgi:uncharacterized protein YndB with AHSA1/START domain
MIELKHNTVINRPVEEVFAYVTNAENLSHWMSELVEAKQESGGPVGVGTTINAVANVLGRRAESIQEVSEYELNSKFAIKSTSGPVENEDKFTFESVAGGTKVTRVTEGEVSGFFRMAEPLVVRMLNRQFETNFANLKDLLEAQA